MKRPTPALPTLPFVARMTRGRFLAGLGASGLGLAALSALPAQAAQQPLAGSRRPPRRLVGRTDQQPRPQGGQTFYTHGHDLPQTQSADRLATWLESEHGAYFIDGWFFFGRLVDEMHPDDVGAFLVALQRVLVAKPGEIYEAYGGGIGFNSASQGHYEYAPVVFRRDTSSNRVVVTSNPWRLDVYSPGQTTPLLTMKTVSGRMGQVGTAYLLEADIPAEMNPSQGGRLQALVWLRDRFGVINQGYGTTAFCPQFVTPAQREEITQHYAGSVSDYLERTRDPMICQGSWYYQLPLLDVEQFSISVGGSLRSQGRSGLLWMDQLVQTFDTQSGVVLLDTAYEFFAIQLPEEDAALMVLHVDSVYGRFPVATYYNERCVRDRNGALQPLYSWPIDGISIEPDPLSVWSSPRSGRTYYRRCRVRLSSPVMSADLTISASFDDQEIQEQSEGLWDYEGIGSVEGTLDGRSVKGMVFLEMVPTTVTSE